MLNNSRLRSSWYVMVCAILLLSISLGSSWISQVGGLRDRDRWIHFFAYMTVVAILSTALKGRTALLLSVAIAAMGLFIELLQPLIIRPIAGRGEILADLFGVGAGILLGFNIKAMRNTAKSSTDAGRDPSGSGTR